MKFIEKQYKLIVALLLIMMLIVEISSSIQESQTVDEGVHLSAGYSYLIKRDYRMNTEHPPLAKELSALPLLFFQDEINSAFDKSAWENYDQWIFAKDLIYDNGNDIADKLFLLGRIPTMLLSMLLGFFVFKWSKEIFGIKIGLLSLVIFTFAPDVIAHSRYVTTDLALTTFFFITIYYFNKYLKSENYKYFIYFCIFFGLTQASKFSAVVLIPIVLILGVFALIVKSKKYKIKTLLFSYLKKCCILIFITCLIIFSSYQFEIKKPIDDINVQNLYKKEKEIINNGTIETFTNVEKRIIQYSDPSTNSGNNLKKFAENAYIPAYSYFNGLVKLMVHNYYGHMSYLLGEHSNFGWWYYFIIAFLVKTPTTILIYLCILLIIASIKLYQYLKEKRIAFSYHPLWLLVFPPFFYFAFSLTSHINLGLRHILPVYPFIFVLCGYLFVIFKNKLTKRVLYILLCFYILSSVLIYPDYLAYFNEISGGPNKGSDYLVDSNIDWGQDVKKLKKYMVKNRIDHVCFSYFGQAELDYYKIDFRYIPDNNNFTSIENLDCVVAISITSLYSKQAEYSWLYDFEPNAKIGYSIFIYDFRKK